MSNKPYVFFGSSNPDIVSKIGRASWSDNIKLGKSTLSKFSDGERRVEIESNVRGYPVYVVQSTCNPANDTLMELLLMVDALRRASASKITAVIPYFGYSRQDRRPGYTRVPISAKLIATMLESAGVDHVITFDIHATQIQGFFNIPVDNISATQLFVADIYANWIDQNPMIVSPDVGGVVRARAIAQMFGINDLAIVDKRRPNANVSEVMNVIGDVANKTCIMVDDIVDTAGTLCKAAEAIKKLGARRVIAYCTHPVLSGKAYDNLSNSVLDQLVVTDTIPMDQKFKELPNIRQRSIVSLLTEVIELDATKQSIGAFLE